MTHHPHPDHRDHGAQDHQTDDHHPEDHRPEDHRPEDHGTDERREEAGVREVGDGVLVDRYRRDRDPEVFAVLVARHQDRMWATAVRMLRDPHDASDVVQMAWVNVLRALIGPSGGSYAGYEGRAAVSTWLHSIVRHQALDRLRRNKIRAYQVLDTDTVIAPRDAFAAADDRMVVAHLLDRLPAEQREAIELVWLRGLSVAEATAVLDVAPGTVKSRCGRARRFMAAAVAHAGLITTALDGDDPTPT